MKNTLSRYGTCFLIIALSISMAMPNLNTQGQIPHAVYGYIFDSNSAPVLGVRVFVNNTATGDTLNTTTDTMGRYLIGIDSYPSEPPFLEGHILSIIALYHNVTSSANLAVTNEPLQICNLTLPLRTFAIQGFINNPDSSDARYFGATVTNTRTDVEVFMLSDSYGFYRVDLATFAQGFEIGDGISVSVNQTGLFGENYCIVDSGDGKILNVTLSDVQRPVPSFYDSPAEVTLYQNYRIVASVSENYLLASVNLYVKKNGESLYTEIAMIRDDGTANDWNADGQPNIQIYGQSTSRNLEVQVDVGDLFYYLVATDAGGNSASLPSESPDSDPFRINVTDPVQPVLAHSPIAYMENWVYYDFLATATDNVAISHVTMNYLLPDSVNPTEVHQREMYPTGDPNQYNTTFRIAYLGTMEYYLMCNDTGGNSVRLPASGYYQVTCADTVAPTITHSPINSANMYSPINFTCTVDPLYDPWFSNNVWLNYTDVHNSDYNFSMSYQDYYWFYLNETGQDTIGTVHYSIHANDTSGNIGSISFAFPVNDPDTPVITHSPPEFFSLNRTSVISAYIEDNLILSSVILAYKPVGSQSFIPVNMTSADLADGRRGNFTAEIPPQTELGTLEYYINATDGVFNISWPAMALSHSIEIVDRELPFLSGLSYNLSAPAWVPFPVSVNVTDNNEVGLAKLFFLNSSASSWQEVAMAMLGSGIYSANIPPQEPGSVKFYVYATDASGNNATLPTSTPKLTSYSAEFYNTTVPELFTESPESVGVNESCSVFIYPEKIGEFTEIELLYSGTRDILKMPLTLTRFQNGAYMGIIPAQSLSGTIEFIVRANDGFVTNQTDTVVISVINGLPLIVHTAATFGPLGENIAISAYIYDDLHVDSAVLSWREFTDTDFTNLTMENRASDFFNVNLYFTEPVTILYYIQAYDTEGASRWPELTEHEMRITDMEPPVIIHVPLQNLTTGQKPIIIANVTDSRAVTNVEVYIQNATTGTEYLPVQMSKASGTDDYAVMLERQPAGNFTYYILASDGTNTVTSPAAGVYTVRVENIGSGGFGSWLLALLIILLIIAAVLVIVHRRKSIK